MNHQEQPLNGPRIIETMLRQSLTSQTKRQAILDETGWDTTMLSKVQSGQAGITIDKFDALCRALGIAVVEISYMDWLARGNVIGSNCYCARQSMGQCGTER
jgi:transcriptional regulator with XRE-family HTH domain